jgi:hypothetical protein
MQIIGIIKDLSQTLVLILTAITLVKTLSKKGT